MTDRLTPQREAEIRKHIAELIYPTYGQRDTERTLAIADAVMPAVRAGVAAELAAVRAERDEIQRYAARLETEICTCQPLLESGDYLHESECRIAEIQMLVGHEEATS